jgi:superfamily II DNA/RNA helicase
LAPGLGFGAWLLAVFVLWWGAAVGKKHDVLVSTPARLVALLQGRVLDLSSVLVCIIDEADKLFDDGFVSQIDEVSEPRTPNPEPRTPNPEPRT